MSVMYTQRLPAIQWLRNLNGVTASSSFPTLSTQGVAPESLRAGPSRNMAGPRVHVAVDYFISTGTASFTASLLGLAAAGTVFEAAPRWFFIKALNGGSSITASTSKWSPDASTIQYSEVIDIGGAQYDRYSTKVVVAGSNDLVTTHIGFEIA